MIIQILGIPFRTDGEKLPERILDAGLIVVPSGPGLANDLVKSAAYRSALREADHVIPDSGLMVLVWNALHIWQPERHLRRYSGLRLLREVLPRAEVRAPGASFWVMPSVADRDGNVEWLRANGFDALSEDDCYVAPMYHPDVDGRIEDRTLVAILEKRRPRIIFLNVGGGTQEQLGWYLSKALSYRPTIICTGAAVAFLSGRQTPISPFADKYYLGWLLRTLSEPKKFGVRYWHSTGLVALIWRYRERLPRMREEK